MSLVTMEHLDISALGHHLLQTWKDAHGASSVRSRLLVGSDVVAVLLDDAFAPAERVLAKCEDGHPIISQYLKGLLDDVCRQGADYIEQATGCKVKAQGTTLQIAEGWAMCVYTLEQPSTSGAER